ncbi:MAG: polysaccharide deacetylase family protein [Pelosinus sp.]|nr:polysaccharide deacetylase family protein [Pelosinus sp.]
MNMTRRGFLKTCAWSLFTMGLSSDLPFVRQSFAAEFNIPVLMYHRVGYTEGPLTVTPERLSGDLSRLLGNGYVPITLQQFEDYMFKQKDDLPRRPVLITFDDGYRDNYEFAFPVLQQYGVAATFFVITGMLNDRIRLSPEQIREMAKYRMTFGSHTVNHQSLGSMPPENVAFELNASKLALEEILGHEVTALSYPCGSYNATTLRIAGECGYSDAFTVRQAICTRWLPQLELPRVPVFSYYADVLDRIARAYS